MKANQLREKYIRFFEERNHQQISPAPLVLAEDSTTLFTSSGMQPLIPYLLGQPHPQGKLLVNSQPCFRGKGFFDDTKDVGDNRHTTFFEMLGNWSLGDYWKKEQLGYCFTFLTDPKEGLGLDPERLYVSVFAGYKKIPKDEESIKIWQNLFKRIGIEAKEGERIIAYGAEKNWWSRSGLPEKMPVGEPGGPSSEIFYRFDVDHDLSYGKECHPNCDCGQFLELGNSVFIEYLKQKDGSFKDLPQKNIDFGGGLERQLAAVNNNPTAPDIFQTDLFSQIIKVIEQFSDKSYQESANQPAMRVIADHLKGATFMIKSGVVPSNKGQGYILRRLLRRAAVKMKMDLDGGLTPQPAFRAISQAVMRTYQGLYFDLSEDGQLIESVINEEMDRFNKSLDQGLRQIEKTNQINAKIAFDLYQSYGFPIEITTELAASKGQNISLADFRREFKKHQQLSQKGAAKKFKGGLADHSDQVIKLHTATHLLHQALRQILGGQVKQVGSNITDQRLRFDFTYPEKLTDQQLSQVEVLVNQKIKEDLPVKKEVVSLEEARKKGALALFDQRYGEEVNLYSIADFSKEVCAGPHLSSTGAVGGVKIIKQEAVGSGRRRIYATLV